MAETIEQTAARYKKEADILAKKIAELKTKHRRLVLAAHALLGEAPPKRTWIGHIEAIKNVLKGGPASTLQIADLLGLTRPTVCNVLSRARDRYFIKLAGSNWGLKESKNGT